MSLEERLAQAIEGENVEEVKSLLEQGANINYGMHAIFMAVTKNKDIVQLLLSHGADVNDELREFEESEDGDIIARTYTPITFMFMDELNESNKRNKIDILKLLLQADVNPNTTCNYEDSRGIMLISMLLHTNPEILFLLLTFGAKLKNEDLTIIGASRYLQRCFTEFEQIKAMPHLGKLIEANIKKEGAKTIAEYINNEAKGQELIQEFKTIKEKYSSDKQLSFVPQYLSDFINHISLTLNKKADEFLSELKNVCQNPSTVSTKSQLEGIEPLAKRQRMER
ncbi:MAG: hypothetical protein U0X86_000852 [Wolbachia endosymbiont of Xenopsylla cheopis]